MRTVSEDRGIRGRGKSEKDGRGWLEGERRGKTRGGCGSGPAIISGDWPVGPTAAATWLDENGPLGAPGEKNSPGETMPPRLGVVRRVVHGVAGAAWYRGLRS